MHSLSEWQSFTRLDLNSVISDGNNLIAIMDDPSLPSDDPCSYARGLSVPSSIGADVEFIGLNPGCDVPIRKDPKLTFVR